MSNENHEQRIAELEKQGQELTKFNADLVGFLWTFGEDNKLVMTKVFEMILASESRNDSVFSVLSHSLPGDVRKEFDRTLGRVLSQRDQLSGMIDAFQARPFLRSRQPTPPA